MVEKSRRKIDVNDDLVKRAEKCGRMYESVDDVFARAMDHLEICNCDKCYSQ